MNSLNPDDIKFERPDWDTWFMALAFLVAQRSLDPATKNGCVIVDDEHTVLAMGYNSPPRGCADDEIPLTRPEKYRFMEHAESNAIINAARAGTSVRGSTFYVTGMPCEECFRKLINVGCRQVVYARINRAHCISPEDEAAIQLMLKNRNLIIREWNDNAALLGLIDQMQRYLELKLN